VAKADFCNSLSAGLKACSTLRTLRQLWDYSDCKPAVELLRKPPGNMP
jgi:hypothetical protein